MSELKPQVEYVIKTGRSVVDKKQVDFPDKLGKQLDAIKQQYNDIGAQVRMLLVRCIVHHLSECNRSKTHVTALSL